MVEEEVGGGLAGVRHISDHLQGVLQPADLIEKLEAFTEHVVDSAVPRKVFFGLERFFAVTETQQVALIDVLEIKLQLIRWQGFSLSGSINI